MANKSLDFFIFGWLLNLFLVSTIHIMLILFPILAVKIIFSNVKWNYGNTRSKAKHIFGLGDAFQHHFGNCSRASLSSPRL